MHLKSAKYSPKCSGPKIDHHHNLTSSLDLAIADGSRTAKTIAWLSYSRFKFYSGWNDHRPLHFIKNFLEILKSPWSSLLICFSSCSFFSSMLERSCCLASSWSFSLNNEFRSLVKWLTLLSYWTFFDLKSSRSSRKMSRSEKMKDETFINTITYQGILAMYTCTQSKSSWLQKRMTKH